MDLDIELLRLINDLDIYKIDNFKYKLVKDNFINKSLFSSDLLKIFLNNNIDSLIFKIINNFIDVIVLNIPSKYLGNFCNNIKDVKLIKKKFNSDIIDNNSFLAGGYACLENTIIYYDKKTYKLLGGNYNEIISQIFTHELLHLASTSVIDNTIYSGVSINNICNGLNEGYTEYLTNKLFNYNSLLTNYEYEKNIIVLFSNFIGNDNMYKCYFTNNQNLFISLLDEYSTYNNTYSLIKKIDFINENKLRRNVSNDIHDKLISYHLDITDYILDIYTNKLISYINDYLLSRDNAINDINTLGLFMFNNVKYIHSLKLDDINKLKDYITMDLTNKYINKILGNKTLGKKYL